MKQSELTQRPLESIVRDLTAWADADPRYRVCVLIVGDDNTDVSGALALGNRTRIIANLACAMADRSTGVLPIYEKAKKMLDEYRDHRQQMLDAIDSSTPNTHDHADR